MVAPLKWGGHHCFPFILMLILITSLLALFSWQDPIAIAQHEHDLHPVDNNLTALHHTNAGKWTTRACPIQDTMTDSHHLTFFHSPSSASTCQTDAQILQQYGDINVRLSRVHEGSRFRLAKVLQRAEAGQQLKVAVLGGSVSTGHGFADGKPFQYGAIKQTWQTFVIEALKTMFPTQQRSNDETTQTPQERILFLDGARPAVDSSFFRYCFPALIGTEADLIFVEMAVNDVYSLSSMNDAEDLLRALLQLPNEPAIIFVDSFALRTKSGRDGMLNGGDAHSSLANFYDIPQISIRGPIIPSLLRDHSLAEPYFKTDVRHIAAPLHEFLGKMVVAFLQETHCQSQQFLIPASSDSTSEFVLRTEQTLGQVPPLKISDDWNEERTYPTSPPTCSIAGADLEPSESSPTWSLYVWKDSKKYLETRKKNSEIKFKVETRQGGQGTILISFLKSKEYGLGKLICQVVSQDEQHEQSTQITVDGYWGKSVSLAQTAVVATGLEPGGTYELRCRTPLKPGPGDRTAFRLMAVMSL
ncbi:hypothetical protein OIO90_000793 [Microbotryomycetes sp. JL221]|nr:hypothetical protein OIO90_000793 [Microbotryomycetes sp. JL221]